MAGLSATRLTDHTLAVSGDYTAYLVAGRAVLCDCGADGEKKRIVESSSFAAGATTVTLVTDATRALTSNLDTIQWSVVSTGTDSNIPYHSHEDDDDGGLITQAITDNHIVTVDGSPNDDEYARWTASGLEGRSEGELMGDLGLETMLKLLTETEILELLNIGATTISSAQWGYLGAMSGQPLESETDTLDDVADRGATTDQALTTGGLDVDGNDIDLGTGELIVNNGGDVVLAASELAYLDGLDQALATTDDPTFAGLTVSDNNELRWYDDGSNYVGFEAPALTADQIWVLPDADGSADQFLQTDGLGNLSWATPSSGVTQQQAMVYGIL